METAVMGSFGGYETSAKEPQVTLVQSHSPVLSIGPTPLGSPLADEANNLTKSLSNIALNGSISSTPPSELTFVDEEEASMEESQLTLALDAAKTEEKPEDCYTFSMVPSAEGIVADGKQILEDEENVESPSSAGQQNTVCSVCYEAHLPRRLVICVDGPRLPGQSVEENINTDSERPSSIHRTFKMAENGVITDEETDQKFLQMPIYYPSVGIMQGQNQDNATTQRETIRAVKSVYKYVCENTCSDKDEVFFFGFSVGAHVAYLVASLLSHLHCVIGKPSNPDEIFESDSFEALYDKALKLWRFESLANSELINTTFPYSRRTIDPKKIAQERKEFQVTKTHQPPLVRFLGMIQLHQVNGSNYPMSLVHTPKTVEHSRHAIAFSKQDNFYRQCQPANYGDFQPVKGQIQAWFFGTHEDLSGTAKDNGLSFWPLQWILSEAYAAGLCLKHFDASETTGVDDVVKSTSMLLWPEVGGEYEVYYQNGIELNMWDLTSSLEKHGHRAVLSSVPPATNRLKIFDTTDNLLGYIAAASPRHRIKDLVKSDAVVEPKGAILHPSIFYHLHAATQPTAWTLDSRLIGHFARKNISKQTKFFWHQEQAIKPKKFRILVCGNTKVGKSTLINRVFGIESAEVNAHKQTSHNIEDEIHSGKDMAESPMIIHDSRGFATGDVDKLNENIEFIQKRVKSTNLNERLHCIWYCVESTNLIIDDALEKLLEKNFQTWHIPFVIVYTKYKSQDHALRGKITDEYEEAHDGDKIPDPLLEKKLDIERREAYKIQEDHIKSLWDKYHSDDSKKDADDDGKINDEPVSLDTKFRTQRVDKFDPASRKALIQQTLSIVDLNVQDLVISAQTESRELKTKAAVKAAVSILRRNKRKLNLFAELRKHSFQKEVKNGIVLEVLRMFFWDINPELVKKLLSDHLGLQDRSFQVSGPKPNSMIGSIAKYSFSKTKMKFIRLKAWLTFVCCVVVTMNNVFKKCRGGKLQKDPVFEDFMHAFSTEFISKVQGRIDKTVSYADCLVVNYTWLAAKAGAVVFEFADK